MQLARKACEQTSWPEADIIDTLAAAYAENGQFDQAVKWQKYAIEVGRSWQPEHVSEARSRLR
ncbi:MAG: hypothetical protein ACREOR_11805 [Candidatus Binatia bacterium]